MARLKTYYEKEVAPASVKRFGYKNRMEVPKIEKIVINMGLGDAIQNINPGQCRAGAFCYSGAKTSHHKG